MRRQTQRRRGPRPDYLRLVKAGESIPQRATEQPKQKPPHILISLVRFIILRALFITIATMKATVVLGTLGFVLWLLTRMDNN